jgi:ADP-dependent NAD(P)H-hydrate dehydratase
MAVTEIVELPELSPRLPESHKGDFGRVLVIAGSRGMSGAAILCGSAALRGGAGLVRVAVPEQIWPIVAAGNPCYMTAPMPQDDQGRLAGVSAAEILNLAANDVLAVGPGLGKSPDLVRLIGHLIREAAQPVILDADGLNNLSVDIAALSSHRSPMVLTPHPGEFARLTGASADTVKSRGDNLAVEFAAKHGVVVVLKGHRTVVTDGQRRYRNSTGNAGMATAGSGDVLTGLITALVGQKLELFAAAQLGVYLHGLAGDLARDERGEEALIASDLLEFLPMAFRKWRQQP